MTKSTTASVADALINARRLVASHPERAVAQAKEIIRCEPTIAEAHFLLSYAYRQLDDAEQAKAAEAKGIDVAFSDPIIKRVDELIGAGELTEANGYLLQYLTDTPNDPVALFQRARVFAAQGKEESGVLLLRALKLAPGLRPAQEMLKTLDLDTPSPSTSEEWFTSEGD